VDGLRPVTLDYANPTVGQPLGSLFTVDWLPDGVRLSRPVPASWVSALMAFLLGAGTLLAAIALAIGMATERGHRQSGEQVVELVVLATYAGTAYVCLSLAWQAGNARTLVLTLHGRDVTITNGVWTVTGRPWRTRRARRFTVSAGRPELPTFRIVAILRVSVGFGLTRQFLYALPREECVWAARLLNDVLAAKRTS
jgi:hypothetical protein